MSRSLLATVAIAALSLGARAQSGCQEIAGNYYCAQTDAVGFNNVGFSGSYNQITAMDSTSCTCASTPFAFSGAVAPLNDEVSLHLRGPIQVAQIAVYHRAANTKVKREAEAEAEPEEHGYGHQFPALARHKRGHMHRHERRATGADVVTVYETVFTTSTRRNTPTTTSSSSSCDSSDMSSVGAVASATSTAAASYAWTRDSYYDAASGENDNLVFLNHLGGTNGSGTWDSCFGNTLSYANCDGVTAAQAPQTLGNVLIPSNNEVVVFTSEACDSSCGFVRSGTPAYKGFSTSSDTVFLLEFTMPRDPSTGFNVDMSAVWFLNAQIPRTLQYGNAQCSCWTTGCGEFDVFEILSTGSDFLTTTLHSWQGTGTQYGGGGCSDYFERPLTTTMKAAILFTQETKALQIVVIDDSVEFGPGLVDSLVETWASTSGSQVNIAG